MMLLNQVTLEPEPTPVRLRLPLSDAGEEKKTELLLRKRAIRALPPGWS